MKNALDDSVDLDFSSYNRDLRSKRETFFNPWRRPATALAQHLVAEVLVRLQTFEAAHQLRQRKRRATDQLVFDKTVTALVCDLLHAVLTGVDEIAVPRSKTVLARKSRYQLPIFGKQFPKLLDLCQNVGLIEQIPGYWSPQGASQRTLVRPSGQLRALIADLGLTSQDLGAEQQMETIVLRAPVRPGAHRKVMIDYPETQETIRLRERMEVVNQRLKTATVNLVTDNVGQPHLTSQRRLRRVFSCNTFTSGGRLFGGFWENLPKDTRRIGLRINEEATVELDYGQMALRLLYSTADVVPTWEDGYLVPLPRLDGSTHLFRDGMKILVNAMLFSTKPLSRKPKGTEKLLPGFMSVGELTEAVLDAHRPVADRFHTGIGHHLQFLESELMVDLLLEAGEREITALPIHDAIIVGRSHATEAKALMEEVFRRRTGLEPVVRVDLPDLSIATASGQ